MRSAAVARHGWFKTFIINILDRGKCLLSHPSSSRRLLMRELQIYLEK